MPFKKATVPQTPPNEIKLLLKRSKITRDTQNLPNLFAISTPATSILPTSTPLSLPIPFTNLMEPLMGIMQHSVYDI